MGRITVFGRPERRRRSSTGERQRILEKAFAPGACVSQVGREHDVSTALIHNWRRKLCLVPAAAQEDHGFVEAVVLEDKVTTPISGQPVIVVELSQGSRVSIFSSSPAMAAAVVEVLAR